MSSKIDTVVNTFQQLLGSLGQITQNLGEYIKLAERQKKDNQSDGVGSVSANETAPPPPLPPVDQPPLPNDDQPP